MEALFDSLQQLLEALIALLSSLGALVLPWTPLLAWIVFWTFAVNWVRLREIIVHQGGWIGIVLLLVVTVLVWGTVAPPEGGFHHLLGLKLSNYFGKLVYVTALFAIMFLCGSVQLAGFGARWAPSAEEPAEPEHHHAHAHGHSH